MNFKEPKIIEQLAFVSVKHHVYLSELYQALISARENKITICEELTISYRGTIKGMAVFLITKGNSVVTQFQVEEIFLKRENISFETWLNTDKIRKQVNRQNLGVELMEIKNLRSGMKKINLKAQVSEIKQPRIVNTQFGSRIKVTDVWLTDETGKINLCLWGEQTNLPIVGDMVHVKGASVRTFKGDMLLNLGHIGTLSVLPPLTTLTSEQTLQTQ
jgi:hypothetical protein